MDDLIAAVKRCNHPAVIDMLDSGVSPNAINEVDLLYLTLAYYLSLVKLLCLLAYSSC